MMGLGFKTIISIRNDTWNKTAYEFFSDFEIIEPNFLFEESASIFNIFKEKDLINKTIISPEYAYEKIGPDKFLIEYIYFITHGRMLHERLLEQIRNLSEKNEEKKIEFIRWVALADIFHVPLHLDKIIDEIKIEGDIQSFLLSLSDEFISVQEDSVSGLHPIRSQHLCNILFEKYPPFEKTALRVLSTVSVPNISTFITNCLLSEKINLYSFIKSLIILFENTNLLIINEVLSGIFVAGEFLFFTKNKNLFKEAFNEMGYGGVLFLLLQFLPVSSIDTTTQLKSIPDFYNPISFIERLKNNAIYEIRGKDLCKIFLSGIIEKFECNPFKLKSSEIGFFLKWINFCNINISNFDQFQTVIFDENLLDDLSLHDFSLLSLEMYRYNREIYEKWFTFYYNKILWYLMSKNDCIEIKIEENLLSFIFIVDSKSSEHNHYQAMNRIKVFRSAIPFCLSYESKGLWLSTFQLLSALDETKKIIKAEKILPPSDIEFNIIWKQSVEGEFYPETYYEYIQKWSELRRTIIQLNNEIINIFINKFENKIYKSNNFVNLLQRVFNQLKFLPPIEIERWEGIGIKFSEQVKGMIVQIKIKDFSNSYQYFLQHYFGINSLKNEKLALINFQDSEKNLNKLHTFFNLVFSEQRNFFNDEQINEEEIQSFYRLRLLLLYKLNSGIECKNILKKLINREKNKEKQIIREIKQLLEPLNQLGIYLQFPKSLICEFPFKNIILTYSVQDPCHVEKELIDLIQIFKFSTKIDYVYLIPTFNHHFFLKYGFMIKVMTIPKLLPLLIENNKEYWKFMSSFIITDDYISHFVNLNKIIIPEMDLHDQLFALFNELDILKELDSIMELGNIELRNRENSNPYLNEIERKYDNVNKNSRLKIIEMVKKNIDSLHEYNMNYPTKDNFSSILSVYSLIIENLEKNKSLKFIEEIDFLHLFNIIGILPLHIIQT